MTNFSFEQIKVLLISPVAVEKAGLSDDRKKLPEGILKGINRMPLSRNLTNRGEDNAYKRKDRKPDYRPLG